MFEFIFYCFSFSFIGAETILVLINVIKFDNNRSQIIAQKLKSEKKNEKDEKDVSQEVEMGVQGLENRRAEIGINENPNLERPREEGVQNDAINNEGAANNDISGFD